MRRSATFPTLTCRLDRRHPLARGLVGWWKAVPDGRGAQWYDLSGYRGHGTLSGMTPASAWTTAGGQRMSLDFAGSPQYVGISSASRYSFGNGTSDTPFSVSAWIRMRTVSPFRILSKATAASGTIEWLLVVSPSGTLAFALYDDATSNQIQVVSTETLTAYANRWTLVSGTYTGSGSASGLSLAIDGVPCAVSTTSNGTYVAMSATTANLEIGRIFGGASNTYFADGQIDDVRIYNRCLSVAELRDLYEDSRTGRYGLLRRPQERFLRANSYYESAAPVGTRFPWPLWAQRVV